MTSKPIALPSVLAENSAGVGTLLPEGKTQPGSNASSRMETVTETNISKSEIEQHVTDDIYHTIVRIVVHTTEFDYELPFKIKGNSLSSGTGFFIDQHGHILTCSHVVEDASHVYVEIPNEGKKQYKASVLGICPFFDLAVIVIENYKNKHFCVLDRQIDTAEDVVRSGDETFALGFPLGQDNLKVTKGIISGQQNRMYQIDTPINPGNSGGPLLKNGKVIGVNGAGIMLANNIGYAVPISRFFLIEKLVFKPKRLIHYPEILGFEYQRTSKEFIEFFGYQCSTITTFAENRTTPADHTHNLDVDDHTRKQHEGLHEADTMHTNRATRKKSTGGKSSTIKRHSRAARPHTEKLRTCKPGGVYVKQTFKHSPIAKTGIRQGDFICALNGVTIDHYGELDRRWMNQKIDISNMLCTLPLNQKVRIDFWSKKKRAKVSKLFVLKEYAMAIRRHYPQFELVDYEVLGGMVIMPLMTNHIQGIFTHNSIKKYSKIENRHQPKLVIASVLMGSFLAQQRTLSKYEILKEVNDHKVETMADFRKAIVKPIRKADQYFIKLATEDRNVAILPTNIIHQEEAHLQEVYKYTPSTLLKRITKGG